MTAQCCIVPQCAVFSAQTKIPFFFFLFFSPSRFLSYSTEIFLVFQLLCLILRIYYIEQASDGIL